VAYDARRTVDSEANEISRLINQIFDHIMSTFFREGAKAEWESKAILPKWADASFASSVLEIWDWVEGPFRPGSRKSDDEPRQAFGALVLPFDQIGGKWRGWAPTRIKCPGMALPVHSSIDHQWLTPQNSSQKSKGTVQAAEIAEHIHAQGVPVHYLPVPAPLNVPDPGERVIYG
jgi:hypothetical protein